MKPQVSIGGIETPGMEEEPKLSFREHLAGKREEAPAPRPALVHSNPFLPGYVPPPKEEIDPLELASHPFPFRSEPAYQKAREALDDLLRKRDELLDERDSDELIAAKRGYDGSDRAFTRLKKAREADVDRLERGRMEAERMGETLRKAARAEVDARIEILERKAEEIETPAADKLDGAMNELVRVLSKIEALMSDAEEEHRAQRPQMAAISNALIAVGEGARRLPDPLTSCHERLDELFGEPSRLGEEIRVSLPRVTRVPPSLKSRRRGG